MAKSAKLSSPVAIRCDMVVNAGRDGILTNMVRRDDIAILHATGVPMAKSPTKLMIKTSIGTYSISIESVG